MSLTLSLAVALLLFTAPGHGALTIDIVTGTEGTVVDAASSQCELVKTVLGVNYNSSAKPDLNELTVDFYINDTVIKYDLTNFSAIMSTDWFNVSAGLIMFLHGFTDNPSKESFQTVNNAFHSIGIDSICALDMSRYIGSQYLPSSTLVRYIGEIMGEQFSKMMAGGLDPLTVYLIGHSLGSHVASFIGKTFYNLTGEKIGRISGLDPAGPCFANLNSSLKLNKTDAVFVDVIHTDKGVFGINQVSGHVDYYPNGGATQPGCSLNDICSHGLVWKFFAESVTNTTGFLAQSCDSWESFKNNRCANNSLSYMGYGSNASSTGLYYLKTNSSSPYALGTDGV